MKKVVIGLALLSSSLVLASDDYRYERGSDQYLHQLEENEAPSDRTEAGLFCKIEGSNSMLYLQLNGIGGSKGQYATLWNNDNETVSGRNIKVLDNKYLVTDELRKLPVTFQFIKYGNEIENLVEVFSLADHSDRPGFDIKMISLTVNKDLKGSISLNNFGEIKKVDCSFDTED